jgi:hypothetical protein
MNIKRIIMVMALVGLMIPVGYSVAVSPNANENSNSGRGNGSELSQLIKKLQDQIKSLQDQQKNLRTDGGSMSKSASETRKAVKIARALDKGVSGDDVAALQAVLALDPAVYPEGVISGVYGPLTEEAVKRFQRKYGLEQVGRVGPRTLVAIETAIKDAGIELEFEDAIDVYDGVLYTTDSDGEDDAAEENSDSDDSDDGDDDGDDNSDDDNDGRGKGKRLCARIAPGHLVAPGWLRRNAAPIVPLCQKLPPGIVKLLETRGSTSTASTSSDRTAPRIRNIDVETTDDEAVVSWRTNERATSKVYYSSSTPVVFGSAWSVGSTTLKTSHELTITDLNDDTTYYYVIESKDAAGNTATTTTRSFQTED